MKATPYIKYKLLNLFFKELRGVLGHLLFRISAILLFLKIDNKGISLLLKSLRTSSNPKAIQLLKNNLTADLSQFLHKDVSEKEALHRSIILSLPKKKGSTIQKGVIVITFTRTFAYYLNRSDFKTFDKYFVFILEPSWAGYADPEILTFLLRATHCIVQSTEKEDRILLNSLFPKGVTTSFGASDWVNPNIFYPKKDTEKKYDSIYVANLNPIKRTYRYIDAIEKIRLIDPNYKGCLVCAGWGGKFEDLQNYVNKKNLAENLLFIPGLSRENLVAMINQSKVNILLSLKEGSNRSLFESMFIDVPVICISENIGVNKSYINEFTGLLIPDEFLEDALLSMKEGWKGYNPRAWALDNISPAATTLKLTSLLKIKMGNKCNTHLQVKTNAPEVEYLNASTNHIEINQRLFYALKDSDEDLFWNEIRSIETSLPSHQNTVN